MMKFHKEHAWAKVDDDTALIGITAYAQGKLTNVVFIELPSVGTMAEQGKKIATIESVKSVSEVISPLSGEVIEVNKELEDSPEIINSDPYVKGWMVKIKIKDKSELDSLMTKEEYESKNN